MSISLRHYFLLSLALSGSAFTQESTTEQWAGFDDVTRIGTSLNADMVELGEGWYWGVNGVYYYLEQLPYLYDQSFDTWYYYLWDDSGAYYYNFGSESWTWFSRDGSTSLPLANDNGNEPFLPVGEIGDVFVLDGQEINRNTDMPILLRQQDTVTLTDEGVSVRLSSIVENYKWTVDGQQFEGSSLPTDVPAGTYSNFTAWDRTYTGPDLDNLTEQPTPQISGSPPGYFAGGHQFDGTEWVFIGGGG